MEDCDCIYRLIHLHLFLFHMHTGFEYILVHFFVLIMFALHPLYFSTKTCVWFFLLNPLTSQLLRVWRITNFLDMPKAGWWSNLGYASWSRFLLFFFLELCDLRANQPAKVLSSRHVWFGTEVCNFFTLFTFQKDTTVLVCYPLFQLWKMRKWS